MVRYTFIYPLLKTFHDALQLNEVIFFLFSLAFVLMAAGGYVINDYHDVEIDRINRPAKMVIGKGYTPEGALELYWILSLTGLLMGLWTTYKMGLPALGTIFFMYMAGLWFYSSYFKYLFLIGNIMVSLFIALVPFTAGLVEIYAEQKNGILGMMITFPNTEILFKGVIAISVFAFLSNLAREIVKDVEDMEGDAKAGCRTVPVMLGIRKTKVFVIIPLLLIPVILFYVVFYSWLFSPFSPNPHVIEIILMLFIGLWPFGIAFTLVLLLTLLICFKTIRAKTPTDFHKVSNWLKVFMVFGICATCFLLSLLYLQFYAV